MKLNAGSAYMTSLLGHVDYVRQAGDKIGVPRAQLGVHDESKFSVAEFGPYANYFFNQDGTQKTERTAADIDDFARAWLHHIHLNPHHWNHWIFPDGYSPGGSIENGVVRMPDNYALEMVADWMGASMAYTGSWDMNEWLLENMPRITVHSATAVFLREVLDTQGYAAVVYLQSFANEGGGA